MFILVGRFFILLLELLRPQPLFLAGLLLALKDILLEPVRTGALPTALLFPRLFSLLLYLEGSLRDLLREETEGGDPVHRLGALLLTLDLDPGGKVF